MHVLRTCVYKGCLRRLRNFKISKLGMLYITGIIIFGTVFWLHFTSVDLEPNSEYILIGAVFLESKIQHMWMNVKLCLLKNFQVIPELDFPKRLTKIFTLVALKLKLKSLELYPKQQNRNWINLFGGRYI